MSLGRNECDRSVISVSNVDIDLFQFLAEAVPRPALVVRQTPNIPMSDFTHYPALIRHSVAVAMLAAGVAGVFAADITGRAIDVNTGSFLPGVAIEVVGREITTVSDANGNYRLTNVPAGAQQVRANYLGYDPAMTAITVPATGDVVADLSLGGEVQKMSAFKVEGYREGRSRALQQKQTATNISDIISADAVGNLPDRNVAEAVARLPGVNLSLEQ